MRRLLRCLSGLCWAGLIVLATRPAYATDHGGEIRPAALITVTEATDLYYEVTEPGILTVRTYAQQYGIDSMLWLYGPDDVLIVSNDDFHGLDSEVSATVEPGTYRLRAGVCCGNPDAWYGQSYIVEANQESSGPPNATTTTTTVPETTTTTTLPAIVETVEGEANENGELTLTSPGGVFTAVVFASYGTPQNYQLGNCHSQQSLAQVSAVFLGNTTGTIQASNSVFGDPCGGTYKRLQVRLAYEPGPATTTTTPETTTTVETTTTTTETPTTTTTEAPATTTEPAQTSTVPATSGPSAPPYEPPATSQPTDDLVPEPDPAPDSAPEPSTAPGTTPEPEPIARPEEPSAPEESSPNGTESEQTVPETSAPEQPAVEPEEEPAEEQLAEEAEALAEADFTELSAEAIVTALDPTVLEVLTEEQTQELVAGIAEAELTDEQAEAIAVALSAAPESVKAVFEEEINIFGGQFDSYVPIGSAITVGQRRAVVAAGAVVAAAGATTTTPRRKET